MHPEIEDIETNVTASRDCSVDGSSQSCVIKITLPFTSYTGILRDALMNVFLKSAYIYCKSSNHFIRFGEAENVSKMSDL